MDVIDTLQKYNIQFVPGDKSVKIVCPFHNDHNPSLSIYKDGGSFICFACGEKGSFSKLIKKITGESIEKENHYIIYHSKNKEDKKLKNINFTIEGDLLSIYDNKRVLDYCWSIGFTNEFIDFFKVVYFTKATFIDHNEIYNEENQPKTYFNRIMIPCLFNGKEYNYECRDFTGKSSKKILYPKNTEPDILFNYDNLNFNEVVYICEGIKGLSHIWSYYSKNVISTFGKAIKENQKKLIRNIPKICCVPDNDENKINKKTNKPVDNILETIESFDSFYDNEYEIAYIPYKGYDPANLTREQIKDVLDKKTTSTNFLINKSGLFESSISINDYSSCLL
jgi:DNA primase